MPVRVVSDVSSPASVHASFAAATAIRTLRSIRRTSLTGPTVSGSKPFTSAAMRTG